MCLLLLYLIFVINIVVLIIMLFLLKSTHKFYTYQHIYFGKQFFTLKIEIKKKVEGKNHLVKKKFNFATLREFCINRIIFSCAKVNV